MELSSFTNKISSLFEETDISKINSSTIFKNLDEWSSLLALTVIAMVDEEYNVTLKGEDIKRANSIEDLFKIICERI